jgi:YD repeat-containing protein
MLAKRWREPGDRDAAHRLVTTHLRLVAKIAMGYRGYGLPISEVISEGNVGLMRRLNASSRTRASGSPPMPHGGSRRRSRNTSCARGPW